MNIHELMEKCKSKEVYTSLLIMLVGFASFGLGRLSGLQESRSPIRIEQAGAVVLSSPATNTGDSKIPIQSPRAGEGVFNPGGQIVASKSGAKYHFPWCSGAQRIAEANKVWFSTTEDARKAGYTPASNCKGLK